MPEISVVILNWNKADETLRCLDSLRQVQPAGVEIIVVDNGSEDGSAERIRSAYPAVTLIETGANLGYAEGNNTGIRSALARGARFVFVLNNDTVVDAGTLDRLQEAARQFPQAAFFGPKILHLEMPTRVQSAGITLDYFWRSQHQDAGEPDLSPDRSPFPVECLSGAALFIRADALEKIGLIDPDFYLYRDDIDWCLRARRLGCQILLVPGARIWHPDPTAREGEFSRITYYMTRNSLLLMNRHRAGWVRKYALLFRFLITSVAWTVRPRWRHKRKERDALLRGIRDYFSHHFGQGPY